MNSVEEVEVRVSQSRRQEILRSLKSNVEPFGELGGEACIRVYWHSRYGSDICVVVFWPWEIPDCGSTEGLRIAAGLRDVGSVRHTISYEAQKSEQQPEKGAKHG
jgi:hypothetical protein